MKAGRPVLDGAAVGRLDDCRTATQYRAIGRRLQEMAAAHPAARCGLETAVLDALCREFDVPLWGLWGGADVRARETDITIPITTVSARLSWRAVGTPKAFAH